VYMCVCVWCVCVYVCVCVCVGAMVNGHKRVKSIDKL
jgi:hypothetical protein